MQNSTTKFRQARRPTIGHIHAIKIAFKSQARKRKFKSLDKIMERRQSTFKSYSHACIKPVHQQEILGQITDA